MGEEVFKYLDDPRTQQETEYHQIIVDHLTQRNLRSFGITPTVKIAVKYQTAKTKEIHLGEGWFCTITDNEIESKHTVMTCHGSPGSQKDWAGLESEMKGTCRWINLIVPGFDGKDERRGNYSGSKEDIVTMILRILNILKIQKIVAVGHSMGSFIWSWFLKTHPERVSGFVSVAGLVDMWYVGLLTFYNQIVVSNGFNKPGVDIQKLAQNDEFRKQITREMNSRSQEVNFAQVQFPYMKESQIFGYAKFATSFQGGLSSLFELNQTLAPGFPKVFLFGRPDPVEDQHKTEMTIFNKVYGPMRPDRFQPFTLKYNQVKNDIALECLAKHSAMLDIENLQSNFVFHFHETGHNVHKRRPVEIAKILAVYFTTIQHLERGQAIPNSRL